jgi:hypothetical protein
MDVWMRRRLAPFAVALGGLVIGAAPAMARPSIEAAAAAVVDCNHSAYGTNVIISSARNMTCRAAVRDMRRYRAPIYRHFRTPGGFACTRVSGMVYGGQWRCVRRTKAYRFEFAD